MRAGPQGFFLISALLIIVSMTALVSVILGRSQTELQSTRRFLTAQAAFHAAEAGADDALAEFTSGGADSITNFSQAEGWVDSTNSACDPGEACTSTFPIGSGTVTVRISDIAASPTTITSIGSAAGNQQTVEVVLELPKSPIFQEAIFGRESVRLDQGVTTDSYNSTKGPYTPAPNTTNRTEHGDIRTNSTTVNTVTLSRNVQVGGNVVVGAHGAPSVVINKAQGVLISGEQISASENLTLPPPQIPAGTPCGGPLNVPRGATQTVNLNTAPFCYSSITVQRDATLAIEGDGQITLGDSARTDLVTSPNSTLLLKGNVIFVAGEVSIGQALTLDTTATLTLYATQSASLNGFVNHGLDPKALSIVYTGTSPLSLTQSTSFHGNIYAPNAEVVLHQAGDFFGSMVAQQVSLDQDGHYHFDESLLEVKNGSSAKGVTVRSWRQP